MICYMLHYAVLCVYMAAWRPGGLAAWRPGHLAAWLRACLHSCSLAAYVPVTSLPALCPAVTGIGAEQKSPTLNSSHVTTPR